mgnify:FL=1
MGRFWTQFEAFLSFRKCTERGLESAPAADQRHTVTCIHNAPASFETGLFDMWSQRTAEEAHTILMKPDVEVTNQSDKVVQLRKLKKLNEDTQRMARS